jgi:hypothetical protein
MEKKRKKRGWKSPKRFASGKKTNPYTKYRSVRSGVAAPETPLFRFQTSLFGYYAFRYLLPACIAATYLIVLFDNYKLYLKGAAAAPLIFCFLHPIQAVCLLLFVLVVWIIRPLSHIIICEEGMFVTRGFARKFIPWSIIRSYHPSRHASPYVILISYYVARNRHQRIYAFTSLETQHTMVEIVNFIHKVRHTAEGEL